VLAQVALAQVALAQVAPTAPSVDGTRLITYTINCHKSLVLHSLRQNQLSQKFWFLGPWALAQVAPTGPKCCWNPLNNLQNQLSQKFGFKYSRAGMLTAPGWTRPWYVRGTDYSPFPLCGPIPPLWPYSPFVALFPQQLKTHKLKTHKLKTHKLKTRQLVHSTTQNS
jgi:hypothetical protein